MQSQNRLFDDLMKLGFSCLRVGKEAVSHLSETLCEKASSHASQDSTSEKTQKVFVDLAAQLVEIRQAQATLEKRLSALEGGAKASKPKTRKTTSTKKRTASTKK